MYPCDVISSVALTTDSYQSVILLPAHPASFAHNFVSGMQSFYFSESQDAIVLQTCHQNYCYGLISLQFGLIDMGNSESQDP